MTVSFDINAIVADYDESDFESAPRQPRDDMFFEFKVAEAEVKPAPAGYLQLACKVEALDGWGVKMFTKFVNCALPVSYQGHEPHEAAGAIFRQFVSALYADGLGYDTVSTDAATGKQVYLLNGSVLTKEQRDAAFKAQAVAAKNVLDGLIGKSGTTTPEQALSGLLGRTFFGKVTVSKKDPRYVNVTNIIGIKPSGIAVCYDADEAFRKE